MLENSISKLSIISRSIYEELTIEAFNIEYTVWLVLWYWLNKLHPYSPRGTYNFEKFPLKGHALLNSWQILYGEFHAKFKNNLIKLYQIASKIKFSNPLNVNWIFILCLAFQYSCIMTLFMSYVWLFRIKLQEHRMNHK